MIPACKTYSNDQQSGDELLERCKMLTKIPTICLRGDDAGVSGLSDSGCSLGSCEHPATVVESSSAES